MLSETEEQEPPTQMAERRAQLQRLLAHPLFSQSKRYPALLRYVVEQRLLQKSAALKERSIGVEVFGRDPNYDVSADPVVRVTAAEVRRRLAQYYVDPAHAGELRIELSAGSYVPSFSHTLAPVPGGTPAGTPLPQARRAAGEPSRTLLVWLAALLGLSIGAAGGFLLRVPAPPTVTQQFWAPVLASHLPLTLCLGAPKETSGFAEQVENVRSADQSPHGQVSDAQSVSDHYRSTGLLQASDVTALTRIATTFAARPYRLMDASDTEYKRLQEGPTVLVGGVDNAWTMRLTQGLRYRMEWDSASRVAQIVDSRAAKAAHPHAWRLETDQPYRTLSTDYALVARYRDTMTGQFVVIVAGLGAEGTEAASEMVASPAYTALLLAGAPGHWQDMNLEAVISTAIIHGEPGPPHVVAAVFW